MLDIMTLGLTLDKTWARSQLQDPNSRPKLFILVSHFVLTQEAFHTTFGVNNLLGAGVEGVIARPEVNVQFRLGRTDVSNDFTVTDHFGIGIPLGVNIRLRHSGLAILGI
jgi:hypothetical protein